MNTRIHLKEKIDLDIAYEVMRFFAKVGTAGGILLGIWALTSLIAGLISAGPLGMVRGYITSITGF